MSVGPEIRENEQGLRMQKCSAPECGADIVFSRTMNDKSIPLDAEPNSAGNIVVEDRGAGRYVAHQFSGRNLESMRARGETIYMPHHATCKDVEAFRERNQA